MSKQSCENCRYFDSHRNRANPEDETPDGSCARRAPTVMPQHHSGASEEFPDMRWWPVWPAVTTDDWCGEFEFRSPADNEKF